MKTYEIDFYFITIGMALIVISIVVAGISAIILRLSKKRINKALNEEYGVPDRYRGTGGK